MGTSLPPDSTRVSAAVGRRFLYRVSGLPRSAVDRLRTGETAQAIADARAINAEIAAAREPTSDLLHHAIGSVADRSARNRLLQLRRDLYHGKPRRAGLATLDASVLPESVWHAITNYEQLLATHRDALERIADAYATELRETRAALRALLAEEDFAAGLLLSSPTLFDARARYVVASLDQLGSRDEHIERGLLRYLTRAAAKATPFAAFCAIGAGQFGADGPSPAGFSGSPAHKCTHVRINKSLHALLWPRLSDRPAIRDRIGVEWNPTTEIVDGSFRFLSAVGRRETLRRIALTESLALIRRYLAEDPHLSYGALVDRLVSTSECDTTPDEARQFIDALLTAGLLQLQRIVGEQQVDWVAPLAQFLRATHDPVALDVATGLGRLETLSERYGRSPVADRSAMGRAVLETVGSLFAAVELPPPTVWDIPLYVDAAAEASLAIPLTPSITSALDAARAFARAIMPVAWPVDDQATMRAFFDGHYARGVSIPLLRFYEDYYREHYKAYLEQVDVAKRAEAPWPDALVNPFGSTRITRTVEARRATTELFRQAWAAAPTAVEVHVPVDAIERAMASVDRAPRPEWSVMLFAALSVGEGESAGRVVLPSAGFQAGYGKYFSRFLYLVPDAVRRDVMADNLAVAAAADADLAEIAGDAEFNGNLHPPLTAWEILGVGHESYAGTTTVRVTELTVDPDPDDAHALVLRSASGRRIIPIDLGFLGNVRRAPLFQLLTRFSPPSSSVVSLPTALDLVPQTGTGGAPTITYRPRMVVEDRVVIGRQRWTVPAALHPRRQPGEDGASYLCRVDEWRRAAGIPAQVYVRVAPRYATGQTEDDGAEEAASQEHDDGVIEAAEPAVTQASRTRHSRDYHKPQFIDFESPLLVNVFGRITGALTDYDMTIEECYPDRSALLTDGADAFASELLILINAIAS